MLPQKFAISSIFLGTPIVGNKAFFALLLYSVFIDLIYMPYSIYFPLILPLLRILLIRDNICLDWWISDDNVLALMFVSRCIEKVVWVVFEELGLGIGAFIDLRVVLLVECTVGPGMMHGEELIRRIVGIIIRVILSWVEMEKVFLEKESVLG